MDYLYIFYAVFTYIFLCGLYKNAYPHEFGEAIDRAMASARKHRINKKRMDPSLLTFFDRKPKAKADLTK